MGAVTYEESGIQLVDDRHFLDSFKVGFDLEYTDFVEGSKEAEEAIDGLYTSKWSNEGAAIRYIKKGCKAKTKTWHKKVKKLNEKRAELDKIELSLGEVFTQHDYVMYSTSYDQKDSCLYSLRLLEIKNGKSKTRSCQHCGKVSKTESLDVQEVARCGGCGGHSPFKSAAFDKKLDTLRQKRNRLKSALLELRKKLRPQSPYLYAYTYSRPDDDCECDDEWDE